MARINRAEPKTATELELRRHEVMSKQEEQNLPGFAERLSADPDATKRFQDQVRRTTSAVRDADEINLEKGLAALRTISQTINETIAEEYRVANPDPETWELRYFKWMVRVVFIRLECPMGEFFLVPQIPAKKPRAKYWYTADEMIDMLHPSVSMTITAFGQLPTRPDSLGRPGFGEQHVHVDLTGDTPKITCDISGGVRHAGEGVR